MNAYSSDTITAIATPAGRGGVGIVRISGKDAKSIALRVVKHSIHPQSRVAYFTPFYSNNGIIIDKGLILFFENPHSFTGEDVVELQAHGSPVVLDQLIRVIIQYGARMARPGEFSERAFLNHKMDLTQAEAIADLIAATSEQAARAAMRSLQGEFSKKIHTLQTSLTHLRMQIEAMIDFPEEDIDFLSDPAVSQLLQQTIDDVMHVKNEASRGVLLQQGLHVVIAGKPNAGKSSLLNYLSGRESAIVTPIPGTTRDIVRESIHIDGMPLHIADTAGLRETTDVVEQEGVRRAYQQMEQADLVLWLLDAGDVDADKCMQEVVCSFPVSQPHHAQTLVIKNKIDLTHEKPEIISHDNFIEVKLSIKNHQGMELLIAAIKKIAGAPASNSLHFNESLDALRGSTDNEPLGSTNAGSSEAPEVLAVPGILLEAGTTEKIVGVQSDETSGFIARRRHVDAIERACQFLLHGQQQLIQNKAGELLAEDLRQAQLTLSEITGELTSDALLGKIFSNFCIGK